MYYTTQITQLTDNQPIGQLSYSPFSAVSQIYMIEYSNKGVVWYAMKTTYKRELKAKEYLDSHGIENFIPMQQEIITKYGRKSVIQKPAIHNLIFVKTDLAGLKDIKISLNYLYNRLMTENGVSIPIVVPTQQMDQFISVTTNHLEKINYIDLTEISLAKGTPVKIVDGDFKGYEGVLERVKGKRDRRVYVSIEGVVAYRFDVEASFIEKL